MTEEERRQRNWVAIRADCTVQGTFEQIVDTIERDVERFNKLDPAKRLQRTLRCERKNMSVLFVGRLNSQNDWVEEEESPGVKIEVRAATKIHAFHGKQCLFQTRHEWNEDTLACDLKIDGKCYSIWQVSQKAIGDLMFGDD
ncbi:MAG: hypothetical protein OXM58_01615 [Rhodospirillaceae bacterium]|nr:hypothetical protein [Rhodospirillaceae bacterium]MDE0618694.1 hypothetical protein [Rhodospirillaceae bacterium]